jgi:hypothetical protein
MSEEIIYPEPEKKQRKKRAPLVEKPCPVTGIPNKHLRYSYLMPEARTPENLAKFRKAKK